MSMDRDHAYQARISSELDFYAEPECVDELPQVHYYWAQRYCLPLFAELGFESLYEFFDHCVAEQCRRCAPDRATMVSLGAGSGETELDIVERLARRGIENLELTLLELNPALLERAMADAARRGMAERVTGVEVDLNEWLPAGTADVYFANHSLHHLVNLEGILAGVKGSMAEDGVLVVNDMIGRNGHVRWPEAADLVHAIWDAAPARYRWNPIEQKVDETYPDTDYGRYTFEGVRAEDILPLLLHHFHPEVYVTFLNVADPFIDRIYGPNFELDNPDDRAFIDALGQFDDAAIDLQLVTPTHLVASFRRSEVPCRYPRRRSPARTVRHPERLAEREPSDAVRASDDGAADPAEVEALRSSVAEAWGRYHHLRQRRAVRAALALAALRRRVLTRR
jgi:SAM-dependent methyltransferase